MMEAAESRPIRRSMRLPSLAQLARTRVNAAGDAQWPPLPDGMCRNCDTPASGKYCPECGQPTRITLPTLRQFSREALGRLIDLDGRLWRTLYALVFKPGFLTLEYFAGRRARYVTPGRLFLAMSVAMFTVLGIVGSPIDMKGPLVIDDRADDGTSDETKSDAHAGEASTLPPKAARSTLNGAIARVESSVQQEFHRRITRFSAMTPREQATRMYGGVLHYAPYAMFALLPVFAFLQLVVYVGRNRQYPRRPRRYAEHLVYGAHVFAFVFLMLLLVVVVNWKPARLFVAAWIVFYAISARRAVYGGRWWAGLARDLVVAIAFAFVLAMAMLATVMVVVMLG
jgi:hypothetical protein